MKKKTYGTKRWILFDFDGVIADSFRLAFEVQKKLCPQITEELSRKRFEGNVNDWAKPGTAHTPACRHDIDFFAEYAPRLVKEVRVVPGMERAIVLLSKRYALAVISSTTTSPIEAFLEARGTRDRFALILGNDVSVSKIEKIGMVREAAGAAADACVFVTDTLGDVREATAAGVGAIGVSWGFHPRETLRRGAPFCIVEEPGLLPKAVAAYFEKRARAV